MARFEKCLHKSVCLHRANIQTDTYAYMGVNYDTEKCEHYKSTADVYKRASMTVRKENEMQHPIHPCIGCIYFKACGENTRTMPREGRMTKSEKKKLIKKRGGQ